jgi:hypothetical protein
LRSRSSSRRVVSGSGVGSFGMAREYRAIHRI